MADYFSPTVIQPAIPAADITPLERLLLSHIFQAEPDGEGLYFHTDEGPADMIWLDRAPIETALAQSNNGRQYSSHRRHRAARARTRGQCRDRTRLQ